MTALYSLFWEPGTGETFDYGSLIDYQPQRVVQYRNPLLSPSRIIHAWHDSQWQQQATPAVPLPLLIPGTTYQFFIDAEQTPANSVGLAIDYYDRQGQRIDDDLHDALHGQFTLPKQTATYQLSLITLNNEHLTFRSLLIGPAAALKNAQVGWPRTDRITNIDCDKSNQDSILDIVLMRQRIGVEALPMPQARHQVYLKLSPTELATPELGQSALQALVKPIVAHYGQARVSRASIRTSGRGTAQAASWLQQLQAGLANKSLR